MFMGFLVEGSETKVLDKIKIATLEANNGAMGVMSIFAHYAECIAEFVERQTVDFPGVFEYEVVPALGVWAAEQQLPGIDMFRHELVRRFADWIEDAKVTYDTVAVTCGTQPAWDVYELRKRGAQRTWVASCKDEGTATLLVRALSA